MSTASFDVSSHVSGDVSGTDRTGEPAAYRDEDFPGCESFHLPESKLDSYEYRLEFWDGATETAWKVCEPTSIYHERPSRRLGRMAERVESLRGSAIETFGSADLLRAAATGRKRWLMQADEVLYLHPDRVRLQGPAIEVDADPLPDVVLEVDHTTDVRRRKLGIYKGSGFPEIWVLVPWESSVRRPGLTIHVRRGDGYREERTSRAFPGWRAEEIFRALTETPMSEGAWRALERVALAMGAREGTKPDDDPLMRSQESDCTDGGPRRRPPGGPRRDARGERACGAERPGHCTGPGSGGASRSPRPTVERCGDGGGAGVHGRGRLPAPGPCAAGGCEALKPAPVQWRRPGAHADTRRDYGLRRWRLRALFPALRQWSNAGRRDERALRRRATDREAG